MCRYSYVTGVSRLPSTPPGVSVVWSHRAAWALPPRRGASRMSLTYRPPIGARVGNPAHLFFGATGAGVQRCVSCVWVELWSPETWLLQTWRLWWDFTWNIFNWLYFIILLPYMFYWHNKYESMFSSIRFRTECKIWFQFDFSICARFIFLP